MNGEWMEGEIREQPLVLAQNAESYLRSARAVGSQSYDMVVLVARGSSDNAALYARYLIEVHTGIPVTLAAPSVLTRFGRRVAYRKSLGIGISQSGAAPDVAEVLGMMQVEDQTTLAITNTPGSRITAEASFHILMGAGLERSVAATKTYTASLLALYQTVRAIEGGLPSPDGLLPDSSWIDRCDLQAREDAAVVVAGDPIFSLGRGYNFSSAQETALKLMECAIIAAKAYSTADFEHGPKALAGPGSVAIVFEEDASALAEQGCQILQAPLPPPHIPVALRPIWNVIYGQLLALHAARLRDKDPDEPPFIQKVTRTI